MNRKSLYLSFFFAKTNMRTHPMTAIVIGMARASFNVVLGLRPCGSLCADVAPGVAAALGAEPWAL